MSDTKKSSPQPASGRFVLRIEPGLHALLRQAAADAGVSLNDYCSQKLSAPMGSLAGSRSASAAVRRAADLFGEKVIGVVVFGSWARSEANPDSDVDLLIAMERSVRVTRGLYRRWDEIPMFWEERLLEPHFVHLPSLKGPCSGVWAEAALDGIVLFEQGFRLSKALARLRRDIASGRIVRKTSHGQPYWAEAV